MEPRILTILFVYLVSDPFTLQVFMCEHLIWALLLETGYTEGQIIIRVLTA